MSDPFLKPPRTSEYAATNAASFAHGLAEGKRVSEGDGLFRLLVESVQDYAIFALDRTGHVLSWNVGAQRFKGYTPSEIIGRHFSTFYEDVDRRARKPERELEIAIRDGRVEDEGWRVRKDGTRFWASVVITALWDSDHELVGFAKVTRDLTERRAAHEQAVEDARRLSLAQEANQTKARFLAAMSHELRTPLNAIAGYADLLLAGIGGAQSAQQREYLERIRSSQQHLLGIINDILNFSRIEAGHVEFDIEDVELDAVIDTVLGMIAPQARAKNVSVSRAKAERGVVRADRAKVEQVLLNLLSNAVKFTDAGGEVYVDYKVGLNLIDVRVADTGIGIPASELEAIFEPFVQVGRNLTSLHEGTGLGLAISSDLARAMGGRLTVTSTVGEGSVFTLSLPLKLRPA